MSDLTRAVNQPYSLRHKHQHKCNGSTVSMPTTDKQVGMRRMDNCLIFGSIPPGYSKTRWLTITCAYMQQRVLAHKCKHKKNKNLCSFYVYGCVGCVLTAVLSCRRHWIKFTQIVITQETSKFIYCSPSMKE